MGNDVLSFQEINQSQVAVVGGKGARPRGAFADRRHPRAGWLLCDDGRLPADHGGGAVDRRPARSAVASEPG